MLHIGQRVKVDEKAPTNEPQLLKYRGVTGTVQELNIDPKIAGGTGATTLAEWPGVLFPEHYLIPIDDDEAFDRFMEKLDLGNPSYSPWLEEAQQ